MEQQTGLGEKYHRVQKPGDQRPEPEPSAIKRPEESRRVIVMHAADRRSQGGRQEDRLSVRDQER